jgi:hypothetical protein
MNMEQLVKLECARETKILRDNQPSATLSTKNPTSPDLGLNLGHDSGKLVTICLCYGIAFPLCRYEIYLNIRISFLKESF